MEVLFRTATELSNRSDCRAIECTEVTSHKLIHYREDTLIAKNLEGLQQ